MRTQRIVFGALLLAAGAVHAQFQQNTDYYSNQLRGSETYFKQQLQAVERYHLPSCTTEAQAQRYKSAADNCIFILNYFPNHPKALLFLSQACQAWKNPHCDPEPYFEKAIAINPNAADTYVIKGIYLLRLDKTSEAIENLKRGVALDAASINAHYNLALAYFKAKQFALSNQHAQLAYRLGSPLPGLREKLKKAGQWRTEEAPQPPQSSGSASQP